MKSGFDFCPDAYKKIGVQFFVTAEQQVMLIIDAMKVRSRIPSSDTRRPRNARTLRRFAGAHIFTLAFALLGALGVSFAPPACAADANADVPVVVYFSPNDKHWPAAEKIIDAVVKKYPRLKVTKVSVDTPTGRQSLKQIEDAYRVKEHGDLTVTFEAFVVVSKDEQRLVEESFEAVAQRVLGIAKLKGKLPVDPKAYAKEIFGPQAETLSCEQALDATDYYLVQIDKKDVGWIANGFHHITCPVCVDTQFLIALKQPDLTVIDMRPVRWLERRGVKLEKPEVDNFMKQFKGRTPQEAAKHVDAISGATTTSTTYQNTINEIVQEIIQREKKPAP